MELKDLDKLYTYKVENQELMNKNKLREVLQYFYILCKRKNIEYYSSNNLWDSFFVNYNNLVNLGLYDDIRLFLKQQKANEMAFIYEYLHYRNNYSELKNKNIIELRGKILKFHDAHEYLKNTNLAPIFSQKLVGECFDRTLDIVSILDESQAVVSYLPNLFVGGFYHGYVRCPDGTLIDPSCNLVIEDEETKELLNGSEIISMTKEEIEATIEEMALINGIEDYDRPQLLKIALYKEYKTLKENKHNRKK